MVCVSPPELDETTLLKYLDGQANERVAGHLEQCPHCRERAQRLAGVEARLRSRLYRADCPSSLELGEYSLHRMPRRQATAVSRHLAECSHCRREVAILHEYLAGLAPDLEGSPVERVKVILAQLVSAGGALGRLPGPALAPAYAGVRGEAAGPSIYSAGKAQIAIDVQEDTQQPGCKAILGLITGIDARGWLTELWQAGKRVAQAPADELGNFVVVGVAPGTYDLTITGPDSEIRIEELDVGAG